MTNEVEPCTFCAIARRESPAYVIFEDDSTIAFAALSPVCVGHTLLIPKIHVANLFELADEQAAALGLSAKSTAMVLRARHQVNALNLLHASGQEAQQSVFHFHVHLVPRRLHDGLDMWLRTVDR